MIEDKGRNEIRIVTLEPNAAVSNYGLWHLEFDGLAGPQTLRRHVRNWNEFSLRGQGTKSTIDQCGNSRAVNRADNCNFQIGACQHATNVSAHVVSGYGWERFKCAMHRTAIWMARKCAREPT